MERILRKKGFTLLELMISFAVLALLFYIGSTSLHSLAPKHLLKKASWEITSRLNAARYKSIFEGRDFRLKFERNAYALEKFEEDANSWKLVEKHALEGVWIETNNTPTFHPQGTVSNLATIVISNNWGKCKITLAISGRVKVAML